MSGNDKLLKIYDSKPEEQLVCRQSVWFQGASYPAQSGGEIEQLSEYSPTGFVFKLQAGIRQKAIF